MPLKVADQNAPDSGHESGDRHQHPQTSQPRSFTIMTTFILSCITLAVAAQPSNQPSLQPESSSPQESSSHVVDVPPGPSSRRSPLSVLFQLVGHSLSAIRSLVCVVLPYRRRTQVEDQTENRNSQFNEIALTRHIAVNISCPDVPPELRICTGTTIVDDRVVLDIPEGNLSIGLERLPNNLNRGTLFAILLHMFCLTATSWIARCNPFIRFAMLFYNLGFLKAEEVMNGLLSVSSGLYFWYLMDQSSTIYVKILKETMLLIIFGLAILDVSRRMRHRI